MSKRFSKFALTMILAGLVLMFFSASSAVAADDDGAADMNKLKRLFEAFSQQQEMLHLLDQSLHTHGVQIFIGQESGYQILDECSVVTAPYTTEDDTMGVLGVIGPTRMAYERVIPIVDVTAKLLASALKSRN